MSIEKPKLIIIAGPNGSGKTSVTGKILEHHWIEGCEYINPVMEGGHDVPISKIVSRFSKSIANCCNISHIVDRLYVYDNTVDFAEPKLLFRAVNGKLEKSYSGINDWAQNILKSLD